MGCKVNSYEIEVMQQKLQQSGYKIVPFDSEADVYIVNTCTVTNIADHKSRQMLRRARKQNPDAVVVAAGCYVQTGGERTALDDCVDLAVGNNRKKDIAEILETFLEEREKGRGREAGCRFFTDETLEAYEETRLERTGGHTRAVIKIQDGCNQFCSYCIIPFARGRVRSRLQKDVLEEVRQLAQNGYKEAVFTGIHLSSYGMDWEGAKEFCPDYLLSLLEEAAGIGGIERIRLGSLEPRIVTEAFAKRLAAIPKICPHFHLSLQSGCDETLRRMNRHYTTGEYYERVQILRRFFTDPAITTDVIVGFPQETEEEFAATKAFLEKIRFFEMHIFPYSRRKGTAADRLSGQLTAALKQERSAQLLLLEAKQSRQYREHYIGRQEEILVEEKKRICGKEYWVGHTKTYVLGAVEAKETDSGLENCLRKGTVAGLLTDKIVVIK